MSDFGFSHSIVIVVNLLVTAAMTGVIWFVQVVHYPLMAQVGADGYRRYQTRHMRLTTWVVGPLMLIEVTTATCLVMFELSHFQLALAWRSLTLLGVIWLSTALFQVPAHNQLLDAFDDSVHRRLVRTNWIRTIGWSLRAVLMTLMVLTCLSPGSADLLSF